MGVARIRGYDGVIAGEIILLRRDRLGPGVHSRIMMQSALGFQVSLRFWLVAGATILMVACGGVDDSDGDGGSSAGSEGTGTESGGESGESGDSAGSEGTGGTDDTGTGDTGTGDTGSPMDCTDDPNACEAGTTCYCFDKTGDGTNVTCSCAPSCDESGDCPAELPNCGCSPNDTKACVSNQMCFGG
jgi:hypothetical protein